jgi:peptide deformylase
MRRTLAAAGRAWRVGAEECAMGLLEVRVFGDPVLRQAALEVRDFDDTLVRLAEDMALTMHAHEGAGLAANQVGVLRRLFTYDDPGDELREPSAGAVVNPVLLGASEESEAADEGCLSFPGLFFPVERQLEVIVRHQDVRGEQHETVLRDFGARSWLTMTSSCRSGSSTSTSPSCRAGGEPPRSSTRSVPGMR